MITTVIATTAHSTQLPTYFAPVRSKPLSGV